MKTLGWLFPKLIILILAFACWKLPLLLQIIAFAVNVWIPDYLPYLDELIQFIGIMGRVMAILGISKDE